MSEPYLSHPVRRMRDDPDPGATAELVVTAAGEGPEVEDLADRLAGAGATVRERLRFGGLRVAVPQERVADICALEGIESIETAGTREVAGGDAGEDVD